MASLNFPSQQRLHVEGDKIVRRGPLATIVLCAVVLLAACGGALAGDGVTVSHAVVVGISDYAGSGSDLTFCDDDARDFAAALTDRDNWTAANVEVIVDLQGTRANIQAAIERMSSRADNDDLCLFFFSGHGTRGVDVPPLDEGGGYDEYICDTDLTVNIRDDELGDWLAGLPTSRVITIICSCYSGGFIKSAGSKGLGPDDPVWAVDNGMAADIKRALDARPGWLSPADIDDNGAGVVITAADKGELCIESFELGHDVLNHYLLQGMAGPANVDSSGWLSAEELYAYAAPRATTYSPIQHAQLYDALPASAFDFLQLAAPLAPTLSWLDDEPFATRGHDPERGQALDWFTFKVRYQGGPPVAVNLHLMRNGVEVAGSPCAMKPGNGSPASGQNFWLRRRLNAGGYTYRFSASDGSAIATGAPTVERDGPAVGNHAPQLSWTGQANFEQDGMDPQGLQPPGTEVTWRVRYLDREGDPAQYVRLHLARLAGDVETEIPGSPFTLAQTGTAPDGAVDYWLSRAMADEGEYVYWFSAREDAGAGFTSEYAYGPPTWWHRRGLRVFNVPPRLVWAPGAGFAADAPPDGVHPNEADPGTVFQFKVRYQDHEGIEPEYVRARVLRWNGVPGAGADYEEIAGSPFAMATGESDFTDATYAVGVLLQSHGRYRHYFSASDEDKQAIGEPSWRKSAGPMVRDNASAPTMVTSLAAAGTSKGGQITFALSAAGSVTVEVLNIAGRSVGHVALDKPMSVGLSTLTWDGRSDAGTRVPAGVYLVRVTVANDGGALASRVATMSVGR